MSDATAQVWQSVTLRIPADKKCVLVGGQWERVNIDGNIFFEATFTRAQLELCLELLRPPTVKERTPDRSKKERKVKPAQMKLM